MRRWDSTMIWITYQRRFLSLGILQENIREHKTFDKRMPGLFKVEAEGKAMTALSPKAYILKKYDDEVKFSFKWLQKHPIITLSLWPTYTPNWPDKIVHQQRIRNPG